VPKTQTLIAVVDDDESMREAISGLMKSLGYPPWPSPPLKGS
jgi:FixJ family two-component response regulator